MAVEVKSNLFATIVMILCFMYGGVSLFFFASQIGALGSAHEMSTTQVFVKGTVNGSPGPIPAGIPGQDTIAVGTQGGFAGPNTAFYFRTNGSNDTNMTESGVRTFAIFRAPEQIERKAKEFAYGIIAISLIGSIISILAGISIFLMLRKNERKLISRGMLDTLTTPEEKIAISQLENHGGELTQSDLVKYTGLSKVKIHRVVKRLEELGVVKKYPYGMTNKLKLNIKKDLLN